MMKKISLAFCIIAVCLVFSANFLYAQSQGKTAPAKKGKEKIVIEFVAFTEQFKKYEVYPWETLKLDDFQRSFLETTREEKFEDWVRSLTGTATNKNRMIQAFKQKFVLIVSCKPHLCDTSQVIVLYDPVKKHTYGVFAADGKFHFFGQPSDNIRDLLNILLVEEFKAVYRGES
jgi:hypothetical protein